MSGTRKACPVVLRRAATRTEILAFRHPTAGCQLVKGTIEGQETIQHAAERELFEESGIAGVATDYLGAAQMTDAKQEWHFVICQVEQLPETWTHWTSDGGGLDFEFFGIPSRMNQTSAGIRFSNRRSLSLSGACFPDQMFVTDPTQTWRRELISAFIRPRHAIRRSGSLYTDTSSVVASEAIQRQIPAILAGLLQPGGLAKTKHGVSRESRSRSKISIGMIECARLPKRGFFASYKNP